MMRIAIDYDGTFSEDPRAWSAALNTLKIAGHEIIGVTARHPEMTSDMSWEYVDLCDEIVFTSGEFKRKFMAENGKKAIDIWIDDAPQMIIEPFTMIGNPI